MARKPSQSDGGSWLILEEMLERGDPAFVDELRKVHDADRLGTFAAKWYNDRRAASRRLLLEYLTRPLNAFRHEPLVKRLFKLAEKAGDDEVMGGFLVLFDRSVRRARRRKYRWDQQTRQSWQEEVLRVPPASTMPRGAAFGHWNPDTRRYEKWPDPQKPVPDWVRERLAGRRLFSVHTRHYLRRRTWRYFRRLGKQHPERYVPAVVAALKLYENPDADDGLALIDNWGLIHILFHHCPALVARPHGWTLAPKHSLAELAPAPIHESLWKGNPQALLELLKEARCRPVRQWAIRLIRRDHPGLVPGLPLVELLALLAHEDQEVAVLAAEALKHATGLNQLSLDRWLQLLETPNPVAVEILCDLMATHLAADAVSLAQAVHLAGSRPLPIARLGLTWLRSKKPESEADCRALLGLAEAEAEPLRPELVRWARGVLSASPDFRTDWVLEFLDSRHADVRAEGWAWMQEEPRARDDVELWRKILESPYDDVRLNLIADLERRIARREALPIEKAQFDPDLVRFLWASVLLNIHRGSRAKPIVVRQLVHRLERRPEEAAALLPILAVALRSVRGPEWRAGLAGVVQLADRHPEFAAAVREQFSELQLT